MPHMPRTPMSLDRVLNYQRLETDSEMTKFKNNKNRYEIYELQGRNKL